MKGKVMGCHFLITLLLLLSGTRSRFVASTGTEKLVDGASLATMTLKTSAMDMLEVTTAMDMLEVTTAMDMLEVTSSLDTKDLGPQKPVSGVWETKMAPDISSAPLALGQSISNGSEASAPGEEMSTASSAGGSAEKSSRIISQSPMTGLDPSVANMTTTAPHSTTRGQGDGSRVPAIDSNSTKPEGTGGALTTHDPRNVTLYPKDGNETSDNPKTTSRSYDHTDQGIDPEGDGIPTTKPTTRPAAKKSDVIKLVLIVVIIVILILLLITILFLMIRKKKRSGSFRTRSRKDVWAGHVPELGDGKAAQDPAALENGRAGPRTEVELTTFASGEKRGDSVGEMNELAPGANGAENVPEEVLLLEGGSANAPEPEGKKEDQFLVPDEEEELLGNGVKK